MVSLETVRNVQHNLYFNLVVTLLETLTATGVIFGFSSLGIILRREGVYAEYCDEPVSNASDVSEAQEKPECEEQSIRLNLIYSVGSAILPFAITFVGPVLDVLGPYRTHLGGCVAFAGGSILLGFSNSHSFDAFIPAVVILSFGAGAIFLSQFQIADHFPVQYGFIHSLINSAFDSSTVVFLVFNVIHRQGISRYSLFMGYALVIVGYGLLRLVVWPPPLFPARLPDLAAEVTENIEHDDIQLELPQLGCTETKVAAEAAGIIVGCDISPAAGVQREPKGPAGHKLLAEAPQAAAGAVEPALLAAVPCPIEETVEASRIEVGRSTFRALDISELPLASQLRTPQFWWFTAWMAITVLRTCFELGTIYDQMLWRTGSVEEAEKQTALFNLLILTSAVFTPAVGYILDRRGLGDAFMLINSLGIICYGILLVPVLELQPVGFILFSIFRAFNFAAATAYVGGVFGRGSFGRIYGLASMSSGLFTLLQYPIVLLTIKHFDGDYTIANGGMIVSGLILYGFPMYIYGTNRKYAAD
ncbi:hypothetical protein CYMTET_26227 [Cymbomonas tetramitiformis]|uniref:Uncharacterized protein n=1 Tax=Cymbomonas tetramitiformis TaxID=36881 RepID=A0AAE0FS97_9CHLO|nr:hypothetical protein CYMTET_26227 [Cymbomonas tetramitiformis]